MVARTVTSAVRLLDELALFSGDFRIQVWFSVDPGSRFSEGVRELLARAGARLLEADQLQTAGIDLILAASENTEIPEIDVPVVMLPHGVGFHKRLRDVDGGARLSGVTVSDLAERDAVRVVLAHPDQRRQLEAVAANLAAHAVTVRDTYLDRLTASLPWRAAYRRALGVDDDQRLIVITSTWGEHALLNLWRRLPGQLLARLPADEYVVAVVLHPNIWSGHGAWQVRSWLADATDAGLVIVPPESGWPAAVVAADLVIGDHGSVTFYAAALARPVLLASTGGPEVAAGTALAQLISGTARWDPGADPRAQIDAALDDFIPDDAAALRDAAFAPEANETVRSLVYDALTLQAPTTSRSRAWPVPRLDPRPAGAFHVQTTPLPGGGIAVDRFPAAVTDEAIGIDLGSRPPGTLRHLAVYDDDLDIGRHQSASVLLGRHSRSVAAARHWITSHRRHHLLTAAAISSTAILVARSTGPLLRITAIHPDDAMPDAMLGTAAVYHLLNQRAVSRQAAASLGDQRERLPRWPAEVTVQVGRTRTIRLRIESEPTSVRPAPE